MQFSCLFLLTLAAVIGAASSSFAAESAAPSPVQLDRFVVTASKESSLTLPLDAATGTGSRLGLVNRDLPASVSVVNQDLIQLRGARTAVEALESAVGMTGGNSVGTIPNYATRGFAGNDITIMRDGIRQNTASQSSRPLDSFLFDRIEVLKGPASLMFGEGAIGGAVNYISKLPDSTFRREVFSSVGPWGAYRVGLGLGGQVAVDQPLSYRLDVTPQSSDGYVDRSAAALNGLAGSVRWQPCATTTLTFSGTFLKDSLESYYGTPVVYDAVIDATGAQVVRKANSATDRLVHPRIAAGTRRHNYDNLDNSTRTENSFWRLIADVKASSALTLRNEAYASTQLLSWRNTENYTWNPVSQLVDRGSFLLIYRDDLIIGDRLDATFDHEVAGRKNRLLVGGFVEHSDMTRNSGQANYSSVMPSVTLFNPVAGLGPSVRYQKTVDIIVDTVALYAEDVYAVRDDLKLVGGVRWDGIDTQRRSLLGLPTFDKRYTPLTGRFGAVWSARPGLNLYASLSKAAQPVSQLVSLNATQADFSLQKGRQIEAGAKATFWQNRADFTLAVFDIVKNDVLTSTLVNNIQTPQQIGAQVSQGGEFSFSVAPTRDWRIEGNLAWTWKAEFQDFFENVSTGVVNRTGNTPPNVPKLVASAFIVRQLGDWQLSAGLRHVGERPANNANLIIMDAFTTVDASVSWCWRSTTVTLRGRNLTNATYQEWAAGSGLMQRIADPRSAELSVRHLF